MGLFFHYPYPQTHEFLKPALKSTFLINMSHNIINWICSNWNKLHVTNFRLKLVITCSFYASLLMYWLSFTWWIIFYVDVSGYGKPIGYPKPAWVWVWAKFYTRHGYGFFSGVFFLRRYGFGQVIPSGFLPIAISTYIYSLLPLFTTQEHDLDSISNLRNTSHSLSHTSCLSHFKSLERNLWVSLRAAVWHPRCLFRVLSGYLS
jgi:hypothetical protein